MGYDYEDTNPVVNLILELDKKDSEKAARKKHDSEKKLSMGDLKSLHSIEVTHPALLQNRDVLDQAEKADRLLRGMKCDCRMKAEFVLRELQRESEEWERRKDTQAGLPVYISIVTLTVSVSSFITTVTGNESYSNLLSIAFLLFVGLATVALLVIIPIARRHFCIKGKRGKISRIEEIAKAIRCWLVVNHDDQPTNQPSQ